MPPVRRTLSQIPDREPASLDVIQEQIDQLTEGELQCKAENRHPYEPVGRNLDNLRAGYYETEERCPRCFVRCYKKVFAASGRYSGSARLDYSDCSEHYRLQAGSGYVDKDGRGAYRLARDAARFGPLVTPPSKGRKASRGKKIA